MTEQQEMKDIHALLKYALEIRDDQDATFNISSTIPVVIDYKNRDRVFIISSQALTLTIEDIGTIGLSANTWQDISFPAGIRIYASGQTSPVKVFVRATDKFMASNNFNIAQIGGANFSLGPQVASLSLSVTPASNSQPFPVDSFTTLLQNSTNTTVGTQIPVIGNDINTTNVQQLSIDIQLTGVAGTNPTILFTFYRKGADGQYYPMFSFPLVTGLPTNPYFLSTSVGPGLSYAISLGTTCNLSWVVGGTATPTYTFSTNTYGK